MKFSEIISISGQPGLFKYVAQAKNGIIVESLSDKKRSSVASTSRVSALSDIAIFTEGEEMPLAKVFTAMYERLGGKEALNHKSEPAKLAAAFAEYLPVYDRERVHASDLKKVFMWYNILVSEGMTTFEEEPKEEKE